MSAVNIIAICLIVMLYQELCKRTGNEVETIHAEAAERGSYDKGE